MSSKPSNFILFSFFNRLRESTSMELDMNQYLAFLELFMKGHAKDEQALLNLCKTLWLSKAEYKDIFEHWFNEAMQNLTNLWFPEANIERSGDQGVVENEAEQKDLGKKGEKTFEASEETTKDTPFDINTTADSKPPNESLKSDTSNLEFTDILINFEEGQRKSRLNAKEKPEEGSEKNTSFIFTAEKHVPVPPRRLGHLLQKLNMRQVYENTFQLDAATMLESYAKNRFIDTLPYRQKRASQQKVTLLIDHGGTMTAFESWADYLFKALSDHPSVSEVEVYYFHQYPSLIEDHIGHKFFRFFYDQNHTKAITLNKMVANKQENSWLIIFSDAGAYQSSIDQEALQHWTDFLDWVKAHGFVLSWVNPVPAQRWTGNLAAFLKMMIRMQPFSPAGMRQTIKWANHAHRNWTT